MLENLEVSLFSYTFALNLPPNGQQVGGKGTNVPLLCKSYQDD